MKYLLYILFLCFSLENVIAEEKLKYLIVSNERYFNSEPLNEFKKFRETDFDVKIVLNTEIGTRTEDYEQFFYNERPDYILFIGNYIDFPSRRIPFQLFVESYNHIVSSFTDSLFKINTPIGLFFVENEQELKNIVNKTILFENNLEQIPNKLYAHSGSIEPLWPWHLEFNDEILTEMYDSHFKPNNYTFQIESPLGGNINGALKDVEAINSGIKYFLYHGHGVIPKWNFGMGVEGISHLRNTEFFPIIFSAACLTGTFTGQASENKHDCLAVKMVSSKNGAAAFIGAFNESGRGQNPLLNGFCKAVNSPEIERLGDAFVFALNSTETPETVKKYFPHVYKAEYNRARLQFHLFGDPALKISGKPSSSIKNAFYEFEIFPNPASDYISITLSSKGLQPFAAEKVQIFDMLGIEVSQTAASLRNIKNTQSVESELLRIDVSQFPKGVYFIRIGTIVKKFVKI